MSKMPNVNVDRIKSLAKKQGITMKFLSNSLGRDDRFLSHVRLGIVFINDHELSFIAEKLNTSVDYLTNQTDNPKAPEDGPELKIPDILKGVQFAFHQGEEGLTQEEVDKLAEFARFLKSQRGQK